ncbi:MAG TPA: ABC transporter permease [Thermoanaerobaculia bacterium]
MNPKLLAVIRREYLQQIRTKGFWIATILIPTIGLGIIFIQVLLGNSMVAKGRIGVVDMTGRLFEPFVTEYQKEGDREPDEEKKASPDRGKKPALPTKMDFFRVDATLETLPDVRKTLNTDVQKERIKAYLVLDAGTLEKGVAEWRAQSVKADIVMREKIAALLSRAATKERLKDRGVDPEIYEKARLRITVDPHEAKEIETETSKDAGFNLAVSGVFFFLIYISIFIYGAYIMRGVMEEKNSRIVEVLISSVRPIDLMLGKIIGIGFVGLTQYAIWGALAVLASLPGVVAMLGMAEGLPPIPGLTIGAFIVFFLLGYFLYAAIYAALAAPFNSEQEAQQLLMIPTMLLVLASTTWFFAFNQPNGLMAVVLSFFPLTSPLLMFMRISVQPPPFWQIGLSVAVLTASVWGMAWLAGRIYRIGILMYGKKPTIPEIFRWIRQAD